MQRPGERGAKGTSGAIKRPRLADDTPDPRDEIERLTRELERSEARFRAVIERNADAIVVVDDRGIVRFVNSAAVRLLGAGRERLLGSQFGFPLVTAETTELDFRCDGEQRVAEMRVVESEWEGQKAWIASLRDVTERNRAERNARELIREHAARAAAERAASRLAVLVESSTLLASSLEYTATLSALAQLCISKFADWAVVYCVEDSGHVRSLEVAHRDASKALLVRELENTSLGTERGQLVDEVLQTRRPVLAPTVDDELLASLTTDRRHAEVVRALGLASLMIVPMIALDQVLGAIALVSARGDHRFGDDDLALAEDVAARAALAVANARLYDEARKANKMKSDILAVVSHDLRTPLTAIIGYVDLMELGIPDPLPDASRQRLQRIRTSAKHLLYLLNELLAFARLDGGHEEARLVEADLCEIARDAATVGEPLALERRLRFRVELPETPLIVRTDPDKVRQVLLNLVGNALKYTQQGEVLVELRANGDGATIRVSDSGVGIAEEHLQHIFEPFWQVDRARRTTGTGLGLSVVRRLVKLLGGRVSVESTPGRGSTFTVTLPRATEATTARDA